MWTDTRDRAPYPPLLAAAASAAARLVDGAGSTGGERSSASFAFILREARRLAEAVPLGQVQPQRAGLEDTAVARVVDLLLGNAPALARGRTSGEELLQDDPLLWERFMVEWPLGSYATLAAEAMEAAGLLEGRVLELGSGVGNASRLVAPAVGQGYIRTDLVEHLLATLSLPGETARYDFDRPGPWRDLDAVLAVNALHCARDKSRTLDHVAEMLRGGGALVLAEGAPETQPGVPWALTFLCGLFVGWWDVGGFLPRVRWGAHLEAAGFDLVAVHRLVDAGHDLGGVLVARKRA